MKFVALSIAALVLFAIPGRAEVTSNIKLPFTMSIFVPCANSGIGEIVVLGGELHVLATATITPSGELTLTTHAQPQGISGQGQITGDKYQGTGVTRTTLHVDTVDGFPFVSSFVNNFRIIGQGPGNNFTVHMTLHTTVNADGTVTATVDNINTGCK